MPRHPPNALTRLIQSPNLAHREQAPPRPRPEPRFRQLSTHVLPAWPRQPVPACAHPNRDAHQRQTTGRSQSHSSSRCQRSEDGGRRTEDRTSALQPRPISYLHADPREPAPASAIASSVLCILSSVLRPAPGGADRDRTGDLLLAKQALSQLSYGPKARCQRPGIRGRRSAGSPSRSARAQGPPSPFGLRRGSLRSLRARRLVGQGRFELPTSRLSSARSNQLSY